MNSSSTYRKIFLQKNLIISSYQTAVVRTSLQDVDGLIALKLVVTHEHESLVRLLLQMGVDVNDTRCGDRAP